MKTLKVFAKTCENCENLCEPKIFSFNLNFIFIYFYSYSLVVEDALLRPPLFPPKLL